MFGKKFFSTVALSSATVSLVGNVGSFAEGTVKVVGNKEIIEDSESTFCVLRFFDDELRACQNLLKRGIVTEIEMAELTEKIEKNRRNFLHNNYLDLDSLSLLDLESIFKGYKFSSAYILGKCKGKKMLGIVSKTEDGRCVENHYWLV